MLRYKFHFLLVILMGIILILQGIGLIFNLGFFDALFALFVIIVAVDLGINISEHFLE